MLSENMMEKSTSCSELYLKGALCFVMLALYWLQITAYLPDYVYGFDHYGNFSLAKNYKEHGISGKAGHDPLIPLFVKYCRDLDLISTSVPIDLGFFLTAPAEWVQDYETGAVINQYPPGFAFLLSLLIKPEKLALAINPILLTLFVLMLFIRFMGTDQFFMVYIFSAFLLFHQDIFNTALYLTADVASLLLIAVVFFMMVMSTSKLQRRWWLFIGLLCGLLILFRYTNVVILFPVVLGAKFLIRKWLDFMICLLLLIAGFIVGGVVPLAWYLYQTTGSVSTLTYGYYDPLDFAYFWPSLREYGKLFFSPDKLSTMVLIAGMFLSLTKKTILFLPRWLILSLAISLGGAYICFFSLYITENADIRYVLPVHLVLFILSSSGFSVLIDKFAKTFNQKIIIAGILILLIFFTSSQWYKKAERINSRVWTRIEDLTENNAVFFATGMAGSIRHYCHRMSYRWAWAPEEIMLASIPFFMENELPVYIIEDMDKRFFNHKLSLILRDFFLREVSVYTDTQCIRLYRIEGAVSDYERNMGFILSDAGNMIFFGNDGLANLSGIPLLCNLEIFNYKTVKIFRDTNEGFMFQGPWSGFQFKLKSRVFPKNENLSFQLEVFQNGADFLVQRAEGFPFQEITRTIAVQTKNEGKWKTESIFLHLTGKSQTEIRIQNDDDNDKIFIRKMLVSQPNYVNEPYFKEEFPEKSERAIRQKKEMAQRIENAEFDNILQLLNETDLYDSFVVEKIFLRLLQLENELPMIKFSDDFIDKLVRVGNYYNLFLFMKIIVKSGDEEMLDKVTVTKIPKFRYPLVRRTALKIALKRNREFAIRELKKMHDKGNFWVRKAVESILEKEKIVLPKVIETPEEAAAEY